MTSPSPYPYSRSEECSWQPEDVARHLASLGGFNSISGDTLLHHGWSSKVVANLRQKYGSNMMNGNDDDTPSTWRIFRKFPFLEPVFSSLLDQLKEPLIVMLLVSALISVGLGNTADSISISFALIIVSLVAAVQEYRSEQALETLANLVPHTCTVLRDGRVSERFPALELVVGDLVLLSKFPTILKSASVFGDILCCIFLTFIFFIFAWTYLFPSQNK
jgi:Ca2+-transporting ATPase